MVERVDWIAHECFEQAVLKCFAQFFVAAINQFCHMFIEGQCRIPDHAQIANFIGEVNGIPVDIDLIARAVDQTS